MLSSHIANDAAVYSEKGMVNQLHTISSVECKENDIVIGSVTKKELTDIYSSHMVGKNKPARKIYDSLLNNAPLGKCPFCGIGHASTLDHFLPKTKYPTLSVAPKNLIPSCKDCNTGKSTSIATTAETQILHPYFDSEKIINERWVFAKITRDLYHSSFPNEVEFFTCPPGHWCNILKERVKYHFNSFDLARKFSIEAANELACQKYIFNEIIIKKNGLQLLVELLHSNFKTNYEYSKNSWKTAVYGALYEYYNNKLRLYNSKKCPVCEGMLRLANKECPACHGDGLISSEINLDLSLIEFNKFECPECNGRTTRCSLCGGTGLIKREKALELMRDRR